MYPVLGLDGLPSSLLSAVRQSALGPVRHRRGQAAVALQAVPLQFTRFAGTGTPEPTKRAAVSLYGYGLSFNTVAHLLGTTAQSVLRWVCRYVDYRCASCRRARRW